MAVGSTAPVELAHLITAGRLPSTAAAFLRHHRQHIRFFVHRLLHLGCGVAWSRSSGINGSGSQPPNPKPKSGTVRQLENICTYIYIRFSQDLNSINSSEIFKTFGILMKRARNPRLQIFVKSFPPSHYMHTSLEFPSASKVGSMFESISTCVQQPTLLRSQSIRYVYKTLSYACL